MSVYAATPADVAFTADAAGGRAEVEIRTAEGSRAAALEPGRPEAVSVAGAPEPSEKLFAVTAVKGRAILDAFRIVARDVSRPVYRADDGISAGLDEPAEGARVTRRFVRVAGRRREAAGASTRSSSGSTGSW